MNPLNEHLKGSLKFEEIPGWLGFNTINWNRVFAMIESPQGVVSYSAELACLDKRETQFQFLFRTRTQRDAAVCEEVLGWTGCAAPKTRGSEQENAATFTAESGEGDRRPFKLAWEGASVYRIQLGNWLVSKCIESRPFDFDFICSGLTATISSSPRKCEFTIERYPGALPLAESTLLACFVWMMSVKHETMGG
ncbi:MAG TPA: hypothetical protein VK956_20705 [Verrucomicrobium sp.]|nr:hypothetical protein [Verrucomicrobium sp.]